MDTLSSSNININAAKNSSLSSINTNKESKCCAECKKPIKGKFVRALEGMFHLDCFRCMDCKEICLTKFFPYKLEDGSFRPLCENDYYKRLDLICARCGNALLDSHINAIGKKYHVEHFCCAKCSVVFKSQDLYYEHNGEIYCQNDYSILYASKCGSCRTSVLKQYIEYNNNKTKTIEKLHLDCYMIYKSWNVRMVPDYVPTKVYNSVEEEFEDKDRMEERVSKVWSVLSAYMESAAECMSKLLNYINSNSINHEIEQANAFIFHIEVLFNALDKIETKMRQYNDSTGLELYNEPKELVRKINYFFSTISHSTGIPHDYTKKFFPLITLLAQTLKILIRTALNCSIKLEYTYNEKDSLTEFLDHLTGVEELQKDVYFCTKYYEMSEKEMKEINTEYCSFCKQYIDDECISNNNYRWHTKCFKCTSCSQSMIDDKKQIVGSRVKTDNNGIILACPDCIEAQNLALANLTSDFQYISNFKQYNILLKTSLKRLYILCPPNTNMSNSINKINVTISKNNKALSKSTRDINGKPTDDSNKLKDNTICSGDDLINSTTEENTDKNCNETTASTDSIQNDQSKDTSELLKPPSSGDEKNNESSTNENPMSSPEEVNKYEFDNTNATDMQKYAENNNSSNNNYGNPYATAYDNIYQSYNIKSEENNVEKADTNKESNENKEDNIVEESPDDSLSKFKRPVTLPDNIITIQRNAIENYQQPICISSLPLDENQILFSDLSAFDVLAVGQKIVEFLDSLLKQENLANQRMIREKVDY